MTILVSDTSVLIDLERGELISCAFKLSATFVVPDVLYERELRDHGGEELMKLGLKVGAEQTRCGSSCRAASIGYPIPQGQHQRTAIKCGGTRRERERYTGHRGLRCGARAGREEQA